MHSNRRNGLSDQQRTGFANLSNSLPSGFSGTNLSTSLPGLDSTSLTSGLTSLGNTSSSSLDGLTNQLSNVNISNANAGTLLGQDAVQGARVNSALFQLAQQSSDDVFIRDGAAKTYINALSNGTNVLADAASAKVAAGGGGGGGGAGGGGGGGAGGP